MNILMVLKIVSVIVTILTGIYSLVRPTKIKDFTGLEAYSPRATTEIRAILGGSFIGLGAAALVFPIPEVYKTLAITYAVIAVIRGISMVTDKSMVKSNVISLATEVVLAVVLYI